MTPRTRFHSLPDAVHSKDGRTFQSLEGTPAATIGFPFFPGEIPFPKTRPGKASARAATQDKPRRRPGSALRRRLRVSLQVCQELVQHPRVRQAQTGTTAGPLILHCHPAWHPGDPSLEARPQKVRRSRPPVDEALRPFESTQPVTNTHGLYRSLWDDSAEIHRRPFQR